VTSTPGAVQRTYLTLTLLTTFAASFIWGVNTLFLLDAGLTNAEAFAANAFFSAGQVVFEVPTGVVADTRGRRFSFLLGIPAIASLAIFQFLWVWNDLLVALSLGRETQPITVAIFSQMRQFSANIELIAPAAFVSLAIPLAVFFAFQRYFVEGLLAGSVK